MINHRTLSVSPLLRLFFSFSGAALIALAAEPAHGSVRRVHPETFTTTITPLSNESHLYLFYSANNLDGTSNYLDFVALPDAAAGVPNTFSTILQVPDSNVFSEKIALISIYTPVAPGGVQPDVVITPLVMVGLSDLTGAAASGQPFESVFPGSIEIQVQQALITSDQMILQSFVQDNINSFSPLISGGPNSPSTADSELVEFSNGKPGGVATVSVVPEPGSMVLIVAGAILVSSVLVKHRHLRPQA